MKKYISHNSFERGLIVAVLSILKTKYCCEIVHRKMGAFFVYFVTFTSNRVYSVFWNQSVVLAVWENAAGVMESNVP